MKNEWDFTIFGGQVFRVFCEGLSTEYYRLFHGPVERKHHKGPSTNDVTVKIDFFNQHTPPPTPYVTFFSLETSQKFNRASQIAEPSPSPKNRDIICGCTLNNLPKITQNSNSSQSSQNPPVR
jgi:hypothetical protein